MYRKFLRPGWICGHLLVVLAVLVCLRLGLWQWHRTHDADGTVQNLGYAVLWPVFGAAFIYMWFRFLQLELLKDAEDDAELTELAAGSTDDRTGEPRPGEVGLGRPALAETKSASTVVTDSPPAELTAADVRSDQAAEVPEKNGPATVSQTMDPAEMGATEEMFPSGRTPSRGITVAVSTVGDDNEDQDPELAAYNRALAALAEKDHRRAR